MQRIKILLLLSIFFISVRGEEMSKFGVTGSISGNLLLTSGNKPPLWMVAREQGRWSNLNSNQFLSVVSTSLHYSVTPFINISAFGEIDYNKSNGDAYIHSASFSTDLYFLNLTIGRHIFSPIFESNYLGHGSYLYGDNNRPIDRITLGIPNYTKLPFSLNKIEIKGEISHGLINDEGGFIYHKKTLLHEKYAYIRLDLGKIKPYAGLNHSALLAGYYYSSSTGFTDNKIPLDYKASFFAKGSNKLGGGEATNAAGAHMGMFDFGAYFSNHLGNFRAYYQAPFADGSGMRLVSRNRDQILGVIWNNTRTSKLEAVTVEWIKTSHQSGNGMPDPYFSFLPGNKLFTTGQIREMSNLDDFATMILAPEKETPYTFDEIMTFITNTYNNGNQFGGRDGNMSNGTYPAGWTYYGMIMGSPLNLTSTQINQNNPNLGNYNRNLIVNDRFKAIHVGLSGWLNSRLEWGSKITYSRNFGSYFHQYPGRYTWDETPDYYFKNGKTQVYSMLSLDWDVAIIENLKLGTTLGLDRGEIFNSTGCRFQAVWQF